MRLIYCRAKRPRGVVFLGIKHLWISFEHLGRFSRNLVGGNAIQGYLDAIMFIPIASIILNLLTFNFQIKLNRLSYSKFV
jgi:hypothetical protein